MEEVFQECIRRPGEGRTVLLSSHILSEVEALCDRVTIIRPAAPWRPEPWTSCGTGPTPSIQAETVPGR